MTTFKEGDRVMVLAVHPTDSYFNDVQVPPFKGTVKGFPRLPKSYPKYKVPKGYYATYIKSDSGEYRFYFAVKLEKLKNHEKI